MSSRRDFLRQSGGIAVGLATPACHVPEEAQDMATLFLCGDVMTGRGIDQVLPHPSDPRLYESYMDSALGYVELAERASGAIPRPAAFDYVWGDALAELGRVAPNLRIVNIETSVTTCDDPAPKGIHYRMHPANAPCLTAAGIDCCVLANNHVMDWSREGLVETVRRLTEAGIRTAGAGRSLAEANAPARLEAGGSRVLVFAVGVGSSGIPAAWAAENGKAGVALLPDLSRKTVERIAARVRAEKRPGDIAVLSIHWGGNWGYAVPAGHREFAHWVVDEAGVDIVHGHSSHHPMGIEVYQDRAIFYGCGDFLNDYEGIQGYEEFRGHLVLMYFVTMARTGVLSRLEMTPLRVRRFRLERMSGKDAVWMRDAMHREGRKLGTEVRLNRDFTLSLEWR